MQCHFKSMQNECSTCKNYAARSPRNRKTPQRTAAFCTGLQLSGGGGDRTRVPQCFHEGLYVCSRLFGVSPDAALVDLVRIRLDENLFNSVRARHDTERFGIGYQRPGVSDEPP